VTGGAGYIGAHVVHLLRERHRVVVFDDLSGGRLDRLPEDVPVVKGSVTDESELARLFDHYHPDGVIHLAARKVASESVLDPGLYEQVNVGGVERLLAAMRRAGIGKLLFASSAAVYGDSGRRPVRERRSRLPVNPYGRTKCEAEDLIAAASGPGLRALTFRQFNVVGAGPHPFATDTSVSSLLPAIFQAVGGGPGLVVRGRDFGTRDGTAVRDYLHVADVARAYVRGVDHLSERLPRAARNQVVNLGSGAGTSVLDLVKLVSQVTGLDVPHRDGPARPGDAAEVVAAVGRARRLRLHPTRSLAEAVASAWKSWQKHQ